MAKLFESLSKIDKLTELYASDLAITKSGMTIKREVHREELNNCDRLAHVYKDNTLYVLVTEKGFKVSIQSPKRVFVSLHKNHPPVGYYMYTGTHQEDEHIFHKFELKP